MNLHKNMIQSSNGQLARLPFLAFLIIIGLATGCKKWYGVPQAGAFLSEQADYTVRTFSPIIGRTNLFSGAFNPDGSTLPLNFQIINMRDANTGLPTTQPLKMQPTLVWTAAYTGLEKSIAEIEAKRKLENHPLWEVRKSGEFILWPVATNDSLPNFQGSTAPLGYLFDVKISNSGGSRILKNLALTPFRERPYDPSNLNALTGAPAAATDSILPTALSGMVGLNTRRPLSNGNRDVYVYFKRTGNGNSLTFKFLDPAQNPIDPSLFNQTQWTTLVHGFNMQMTSLYVRYDVAYPIPLVMLPTAYTTADGTKAAVEFSYTRLGFNGIRETGKLDFNFSIFRQGDWEIDFHFHNDSPRFQNEY